MNSDYIEINRRKYPKNFMGGMLQSDMEKSAVEIPHPPSDSPTLWGFPMLLVPESKPKEEEMIHYIRDHSRGILWRVERGEFGTEIRVRVSWRSND